METAAATIGRVTGDATNTGWLRDLAGKFIVFEGGDGSGKSTQYAHFATACRDAGVKVTEVREPGGTKIGEHIREILLDPSHTEMSLRCEMMLYMASRAQLIEQVIRPALANNELVLADRFVSSTVAYQGHAGGLPLEDIQHVALAAIGPVMGEGGCWPDLTIVFDVDRETSNGRVSAERDRMELKGEAYHAKVREGYLTQAREHPERFTVVDASGDVESVTRAMLEAVRAHPSLGLSSK